MSENTLPVEPNDLNTIAAGYLGTTPPPGRLLPRGERLWIDQPEQLLRAVSRMKHASVIAVDAEFTQARSRAHNDGLTTVPRLALLQLAIDGVCFVIDALRLSGLAPLMKVFGNAEQSVLLHGAGADLRVMAERELHIVHYYDLEAACRSIFGQQESSLAAMLQRAFGIHLDKSLQRTDWTRRPLPPAMIAYAARDAEVTLGLYYWLAEHYSAVLQLHEYTDQANSVSSWIEPFLYGTSTLSPEMAVAQAKTQGLIRHKTQVPEDCRTALHTLTHPMHRSRLLRLIADLALVTLVPDIEPLLEAPTSDERAAATRALGRLAIKSSSAPIRLLLHDPVYDVRKAALLALRLLSEKETHQQRESRTPSTKTSDGTRTWTIDATPQPDAPGDENDWKTRLRSMMDE